MFFILTGEYSHKIDIRCTKSTKKIDESDCFGKPYKDFTLFFLLI